MDFERIRSVFQIVGPPRSRRGQLVRLANRYEAGIQTVGQGRPKDKSPRFDAQDQVHILEADVVRRERIHQGRVTLLVLEQGGDVVKENTRLGKVWNGPDKRFQRLTVNRGVSHA